MKRILDKKTHRVSGEINITALGKGHKVIDKIAINIIFYDDENLTIESVDIILTDYLLKYEKENTWSIRNHEEESKYIDILLNQGEIRSTIRLIDANDLIDKFNENPFNKNDILKNWGDGKELKYWENNYKNLSENFKLLRRLKNIKTLNI